MFPDLARLLQRTGPSAIENLRPGLSPRDVRTIVEQHAPERLPLIDETIEWWWSWHNGVHPSAGSNMIATDSLPIESLDSALGLVAPGVFLDKIDAIGGQSFPLGHTDFTDAFWLQRATSQDPWTIWWYDKEHDATPVSRSHDHGEVLFADYVDALVLASRDWSARRSNYYPW